MKQPEGGATTLPVPGHLADIRPLERADLPQAAALFELVMGSGVRRPDPVMVALLERTLFGNPWADPELPSLVAVDERARIIGFIGAEVRRMRFHGRPARAVWAQHLVVDPAARRLAVGAVLLNRMLGGAQDMTFTDSASDVVREMWGRLGGETLQLKGIHWVRVLRPWAVGACMTAAPARPRLRAALAALTRALDAATNAGSGRYLEPPAVEEAASPLTPATLLDALPAVGERLALYPDYDEPFLNWLFRELVTVGRRGRLVAQLVSSRSGRRLGWYLYFLRPGWRSEVLQVAARQGHAGRVLDHLLRHAYEHGSAVVRGRLEPSLVEAVVRRKCLLWHRGGTLAHSRDPELLRAVHLEETLVTRLEGEWWSDTFI